MTHDDGVRVDGASCASGPAGSAGPGRVLYYALGGGLGHITRGRAFLNTVVPGAPALILSAHERIEDDRVLGPHRGLRVPVELQGRPVEWLRWLRSIVQSERITEIVVDVFPGGILGEFHEDWLPPEVARTLVARRLRWGAYRRRWSRSFRYDRTFVVEDLEPEQEAWIEAHGGTRIPLDLHEPPVAGPVPELPEHAWLIVHSGPAPELDELIAHARERARMEGVEPALVMVSPRHEPPAGVAALDFYPARLLFPQAERIVTACGFNSMRQTEDYRDRHEFLPFERPLDDQFRRAAARRRSLRA